MLKKLLILIVISFLTIPSEVLNAQQLTGLTISPAIIVTSQNSGAKQKYTLKIYSDINRTIDVSVRALNKSTDAHKPVVGEIVSPEFMNWFVGLKQQIFIKASEENILDVNVEIPDYYLGNYNFALVFEESSPQVVDNT